MPERNNSKILPLKEKINVRASQEVVSKEQRLQVSHNRDGRSEKRSMNEYDNRQQIHSSAS